MAIAHISNAWYWRIACWPRKILRIFNIFTRFLLSDLKHHHQFLLYVFQAQLAQSVFCWSRVYVSEICALGIHSCRGPLFQVEKFAVYTLCPLPFLPAPCWNNCTSAALFRAYFATNGEESLSYVAAVGTVAFSMSPVPSSFCLMHISCYRLRQPFQNERSNKFCVCFTDARAIFMRTLQAVILTAHHDLTQRESHSELNVKRPSGQLSFEIAKQSSDKCSFTFD